MSDPRPIDMLWCKARLGRAVALIAFIAVGAQAEPTRTVKVILQAQCGADRKEITLVLNRDEAVPVPLAPDATHRIWTGEWLDPNPQKTFNAAKATASLRLTGRRTDCQPSFAEETAPDTYIARFTFSCNERPVQNVQINTDPVLPVGYMRSMYRTEPQGIDCHEHAFFSQDHVPVTVPDVRLEGEQLGLQLAWDEQNPEAPALILFSEPREAPGFDPAVVRHAQKVDDTLVLDADAVVAVLKDQRAKRDLSSAEIDFHADKFRRARLQRVVLQTVK